MKKLFARFKKVSTPTDLPLKKLLRELKMSYGYLKRTARREHQAMTPCYLVIGQESVGKSTLLKQSGKPLPLFPMENAESLANIHITEQAMFIEIDSRFLKLQQDDDTKIRFAQCLKALKQYRRRLNFSAILFAYDLPSLLGSDNNEKMQAMHECANRIQHALKHQLPGYLLITQMDRLTGFETFFNHLKLEHRNQAWGMNLSASADFVSQYEFLLRELNSQLLTRLHRQSDREDVHLIAGFPLQMASIKMALNQAIKNLIRPTIHHQALGLAGVYFTSAAQQGEPINHLLGVMAKPAKSLSLPSAFSTQPDHYFISELFKTILPTSLFNYRKRQTFKRQKTLRIAIISGLASLFIIITTLSYQSYRTNQTEISQLQETLQNYAQLPDDPEQRLIWLSQTMTQEQSKINTFAYQLSHFGLTQAADLYDQLQQNYLKQLQAILIPSLANIATIQMTDQSNSANDRYLALKVYLMLGEPQHLQKNLLNQWAKQYWQKALPQAGSVQSLLQSQLNNLLSANWQSIKIDSETVATVRQQLLSLPNTQLAYISIAESNAAWNIPALTLDDQTINNYNQLFNTPLSLPGFYTKDGEAFFKQAQTNLSQILFHENWVLSQTITLPDDSQFALSSLYHLDANQHWQIFMKQITPPTSDDLLGAISFMQSLKHSESSLIKGMTMVQANLPATLQNVDSSLFMNVNFKQLKALSEQFSKVQHTLLTLSNSNTEAAYTMAKALVNNDPQNPIVSLQQSARKLPQPLQNYVAAVAKNSARAVYTEARVYLNTLWQANVYDQYSLQLANRYPLMKSAKDEAAIADFSQFFGKGGALDTYVQTYLLPFIKIDNGIWQLKSSQETNLGLSNNVLQALQKAYSLQSAIFNGTQIALPLNLLPVNLDGNASSAILNIGSQSLIYQHDPQLTTTLQWSATMQPSLVSLNLIDLQGKRSSFTTEGPWSWWHFMDNCQLQKQDDTRFLLSCSLANHTVSYQIQANSMVNPFELDIHTISLPQSL